MDAVDAGPQENCYQILGVQPRASQEVLDAAYRRLVRIHTGEYMDDPSVVAGPQPKDPYLARVDRAYRLLSDPLKRQEHDEALRAAKILPLTEEELELARRRFDPTGAWLAYQRQEDGTFYVRVGWASDFTAVRAALEEAVPPSARTFNPRLNEWRVEGAYEDALAEIFDNFQRPDEPPPPPQIGPIYPRREFTPSLGRTRQPWQGWPFVLIGGLLLATIGTLIFPANRADPVAVQATATAIAVVNAFEPVESRFPTATPSPVPVLILPGRLLFPSVNLRAEPGTDAPVLALLSSEPTYAVVGRLADSSWFVLAAEEQIGWVAGWTLEVGPEAEDLAVYGAEEPLPETIPTATPVPEAADESLVEE